MRVCERRSPCGERGLKLLAALAAAGGSASLPVRGAWVEIRPFPASGIPGVGSLPVRGAWVEIGEPFLIMSSEGSLPVRGAWVEILRLRRDVALLACRSPCGERGLKSGAGLPNQPGHDVAPRAGSVG